MATLSLCVRFLGIAVLAALPPVLGSALGVRAAGPRGLVFVRDDDVFYRPPGGSPVFIAKGASPQLSAQGTSMLYLAPDKAGGELKHIVWQTVDGKSRRILYSGRERLRNLAWSSKNTLLFLSWNGARDELRTLDWPEVGEPRRPLWEAGLEEGWVFNPRWSPDASAILYHDNQTLFRLKLADGRLTRTPLETITGRKNNVDSGCSFVEDPTKPGRYAYVAAVRGPKAFEDVVGGEPLSALFVYDSATRRRTRLSPPDMVAMDPAWAPDGSALYVCGYRQPHYRQAYPFRIYRLRPDGTGLTDLGKGETPGT
ncbi:MAG: PD40 domain-containing protein [Fimbriimonadaceae bacterium]|nr:PD40 domain-containing protein [Fimbriimonadaceae bacterium]